MYPPNALDVDQVCRLVAAGRNVVTTCGTSHHPASMDRDVRARVEAACKAGGSSIHGTGSSPGFITEAVPLVPTSIQRRLNHSSSTSTPISPNAIRPNNSSIS